MPSTAHTSIVDSHGTSAPHPRRHALAHAARPSVWAAALEVDMSKASIAVPVRVGFAMALVLVVGGLTGFRDIAGFAALGALISAFCRPDPYRVRIGRLTFLGIGMTTAVAVGAALGLADSPLPVEIVVICVLGGFAALLVSMLHITGPGAVVVVFAATASAGYVHTIDDLVHAVVATALGAVVGGIASLAPWIVDPVRRRVTGRPTPVDDATRERPRYESIATTLLRAPARDVLINSVRLTVAGILSGSAAAALGLDHPMWAAMGAMATMQGVAYHVTVSRGVQRLLGNIAGGLIAALLLGLGLGYWGAVIAIVICQVTAEYMATVNYAITSTVVTPMALLMTALSVGLTPEAAVARVADTLLGVVIGIVVAAVAISGADRRSFSLPSHKGNELHTR